MTFTRALADALTTIYHPEFVRNAMAIQRACLAAICVFLINIGGASAQVGSPLAPMEITFEGIFSIPLEMRAPIIRVLGDHRARLPDESAFTASAYRDDGAGAWAKVTLVPTSVVELGWQHLEFLDAQIVEVILMRNVWQEWAAFLVDSPPFAQIAPLVPTGFVDMRGYTAPIQIDGVMASDLPLPPLEGEYRLPWRAGQTWWATQGWHEGNAVDFQPSLSAVSTSVLAAENGRLTEVCRDGYQSLLRIAHADGISTYYLHVQMGVEARRRLDQNVVRGQVLGELLRIVPFAFACGQGLSRHLHFVASDRALVLEGLPLEAVAATAQCCASPPLYTSSNEAVEP